jgi:hypothetical protein
MNSRLRIAVKLIWMTMLVFALVLFSRVRYDFVYQGF